MAPGMLLPASAVAAVELPLRLHPGAAHDSLLPSPQWMFVVLLVVGAVLYLRVGRGVGHVRLVALGVVVGIGGYVGDVVWHTNHAVAPDAATVLPPHLLIVIGGLVASVGAVEVARDADTAATVVAGLTAVAAAAVAVGELWIDASLALGRGQPDSSLPLTLVNGGFLVLVLGAGVVYLLRKLEGRSGVVS